MIIPEYSSYYYQNNKVYRCSNDTEVTTTTSRNSEIVKVKNDEGKWKSVALSTIKALTGDKLEMPKDAVQVIGYRSIHVDTKGNVYSFSINTPQGTVLAHTISQNGYPHVSLNQDGNTRKVSIHQLMAETFLQQNYVALGLCCMHKDDNKLNCNLDNLEIGTYSQNNKDAYNRGLNPGNGLKL